MLFLNDSIFIPFFMNLTGQNITSFQLQNSQIMTLRDCNYSWFANIFTQMLLFHGLNTISFSSSSSSSSSSSHPSSSFYSDSPAEISKFGSSSSNINKQRKLEVRMGPGGNAYSTGTKWSTAHRGHHGKVDPILNDPYEEPALHFGGNQQFFFRFIVLLNNHRFSRCLEDVIAHEIGSLCGETESSKSLSSGTGKGSSSGRTGTGRTDQESGASYFSSPIGMRARVNSFPTEGDNIFNSSSSSVNKANSAEIGMDMDTDINESEHFTSQENYASSAQSFALRTVKMRILGKFLGLLTFWPQWSLSVCQQEIGPLTILAGETARLKGSLRPATSYPLRHILEQAWVSNRLAYTVPWIVEFLKMIVWDCTYLQKFNPYRNVFGILRSIQKSDALHPLGGKCTSNLLYVLMEIQSLWTALSLKMSDICIVPLPINKGKNSKNYDRSGGILKIDEENAAFSLSFLYHVTVFLNETLEIFKKRLRLNQSKKHVPVRTGSNITLQATPGLSGNIIARTTTIKRQTPNLVGSLGNQEVQLPQSSRTFSASPYGVGNNFQFSSPSDSKSKHFLQNLIQGPDHRLIQSESQNGSSTKQNEKSVCEEDSTLFVISPSLSSSGAGAGIVGTSLMAQFSAVAIGTKKQKPKKTKEMTTESVNELVTEEGSLLALDSQKSFSGFVDKTLQGGLLLSKSDSKQQKVFTTSTSSSSSKMTRKRSTSSSTSSSNVTPLINRTAQPAPTPPFSSTTLIKSISSTPLGTDGGHRATPGTISTDHDCSPLTDRCVNLFLSMLQSWLLYSHIRNYYPLVAVAT